MCVCVLYISLCEPYRCVSVCCILACVSRTGVCLCAVYYPLWAVPVCVCVLYISLCKPYRCVSVYCILTCVNRTSVCLYACLCEPYQCVISVGVLMCVVVVAAGDHSSLSAHAVPTGRHSGGLPGQPEAGRQTEPQQAEADHSGDGREAGQGYEGRQVCRMLRPHSGEAD